MIVFGFTEAFEQIVELALIRLRLSAFICG
jgi:hypothetical protein